MGRWGGEMRSWGGRKEVGKWGSEEVGKWRGKKVGR